MSLKLKLTALVGLCLALVVNTACKSDKAKQKTQEVCAQVIRVCKDGSTAVRDGASSCRQRCPEDTDTSTSTSTTSTTNTVTETQTNTVTETQTNTN